MEEFYDFMPEYKPPKSNLVNEIYIEMKGYLRKYKINHTNSEIILIRKKVLENLEREGITQERYGEQGDWTKLKGTLINQIDTFYNTNIAKDIRNEFLGKK